MMEEEEWIPRGEKEEVIWAMLSQFGYYATQFRVGEELLPDAATGRSYYPLFMYKNATNILITGGKYFPEKDGKRNLAVILQNPSTGKQVQKNRVEWLSKDGVVEKTISVYGQNWDAWEPLMTLDEVLDEAKIPRREMLFYYDKETNKFKLKPEYLVEGALDRVRAQEAEYAKLCKFPCD